METPPVIPPEQVKEKLSSLGINPNQVSSTGNTTVVGSSGKKPPVFLTVITLVLLLAAIAGGIFLVQKRQELRRKAQEVAGDVRPCDDGPGGCCDPEDPYNSNCGCRSWEECLTDNGTCYYNKSCCAKDGSGCSQNSDCCNQNCQNGICGGGGGGLVWCRRTGPGHITIYNSFPDPQTKTWKMGFCDFDDPNHTCDGLCDAKDQGSVTVPGGSQQNPGTLTVGQDPHCNIVQVDVVDCQPEPGTFDCHWDDSCEASPTPTATRTPTPTPTRSITPTPTPTSRLTPTPTTTPPPGLTCVDLTQNPQPPIKIGDSVVFTCSTDRATNPLFDHFDYRLAIDSGTWQTPVGWQEIKGSTPAYKIDKAGSYRIQCRVCGLEHQCTAWGGAVINSL